MFDPKEFSALLSLSRLTIPTEQHEAIAGQVDDILHYFERLSAFDTSSVDIDLGETVAVDSRRRDESRTGLNRDEIESFSNSIDADGFFNVPRILGDEHE